MSARSGRTIVKAMGRPREFDEAEVLERALEVFWAKGYEATSITDLMHATGLAKGSVYKGFGDKRSFFLRALESYLSRGRAKYQGFDDGALDAVEVLRAWMLHGLDLRSATGQACNGCFAVNTSIELAAHDDDVRERLRVHNRKLERMYAATLRRGIKAGSVRADIDVGRTARWVATVISGLQVSAKTGMSPADGAAFIDMSLAAVKP